MSEHMKKSDPLDRLNGLAVCPVCGCFDRKGMYRCSECGTFHAGGIMEEREAPLPSEQRELEAAAPPLDPSVYSLGPNASIPEESFDESDDVRSWEGGSTDFTFDEDDDPPVAHITLPEAEDVTSDED
ncbi:MAG: hypothetical protein VYD44_03255 [Candidatus Thermoplasmatota archaeon]|nr:hypothetical protein [Candidatus Thermoplasmatota archaeon]